MPQENLDATVNPIWCFSPIHPQATAKRPVMTPPAAFEVLSVIPVVLLYIRRASHIPHILLLVVDLDRRRVMCYLSTMQKYKNQKRSSILKAWAALAGFREYSRFDAPRTEISPYSPGTTLRRDGDQIPITPSGVFIVTVLIDWARIYH